MRQEAPAWRAVRLPQERHRVERPNHVEGAGEGLTASFSLRIACRIVGGGGRRGGNGAGGPCPPVLRNKSAAPPAGPSLVGVE